MVNQRKKQPQIAAKLRAAWSGFREFSNYLATRRHDKTIPHANSCEELRKNAIVRRFARFSDYSHVFTHWERYAVLSR